VSRVILTCGIPIPNGNMEFKSDGFGQAFNIPDGWRKSVQYGADEVTKIKEYWTTTRRGDSNYPYAPIYSSRGRCFTVGVRDTATATATRYIESPPSPPGYLWGTDANDPLATGNDFWWVRLRFWWRGWGIAPGASAAWVMSLIGYVDAAESSSVTLCTVPLNGVSDWGTVWAVKSSSPFKITSSLHHVRVRVTCERGPATTGYAYGSFTDFSAETLGPVDAAAVSTSFEILNPTYAEEGIGGTFYQMSKDRIWDGYDNQPTRPGKGSRLPSGSWRWFDATGGTKKRRFVVPLRMMTRKDAVKLELLFMANKGQSGDSGSFYGTAFPLLFSPQQPDAMGFYYVAMEDEKPNIQQDGYFQSATELGTLYRCNLALVEI